MPRALIIGSGVAGPAVALFLRRTGWDVEIYEAANAPDPYAGLFLNVATNGLAVLDELGLREPLVAEAHRAPNMVMWSSTGRELGTVPNGPAGQPARGSVVVRRGILHRVLREAAQGAGIPIRFGARLERIEQTVALRVVKPVEQAAPRPATSSSAPTGSGLRRAATSMRMPPHPRTPDSSASAASPTCPASRPLPTRSTWCSGGARSSATSCATTARCTGSPTSRAPPPTEPPSAR